MYRVVGTSLYARGVVVFGMYGFFYAIVLTAGNAFDTRKNRDFSATTYAKVLFYRSVTYPVLWGLGWPVWFPLALVTELELLRHKWSEKK